MEKKEIYEYINNLRNADDSDLYKEAEYHLIRYSEESLPHLHEAILIHPSAMVRKSIVSILFFFKNESSIPFLHQVILCDKEYAIKAEAIMALGEISHANALEVLFDVFSIREIHQGQDLIYTIARKFCLSALPYLRNLLYAEEEWLREKAANCVHFMKCEKISLINGLIFALSSREFFVRDAAVTALAGKEFDSALQVETLETVVQNDEDNFVRENAVNCLREIKKRK